MTAGAGIGALTDDEYFKQNCKKIIENREWTKNRLNELGFETLPSKANFLFAKNDKISGKTLYEKLKERGVLVRHFDKERIKEYNRITIGSHEQMQIFIDCVKSILES
jgi:histidinol-phosphate aminotransferase